MGSFTSEIRAGMQIDWDVPITMDDGLQVRADIFRLLKKESILPLLLMDLTQNIFISNRFIRLAGTE
jgi:predicted acyl esterase